MRISRLLVAGPLVAGGVLSLEGETSHYLKSVLRLKKGWRLTIFDGAGYECLATVEGFGRDTTHLRLDTPEAINRESPLKIHLALGISRGERMDFAIQKAVELGVDEITPLLTEFCVVRLNEERKSNRQHHWQGIIRSACEQSGRNRLPTLHATCRLDDWLGQRENAGNILMLDPEGEPGFGSQPKPQDGLTLLIGPEGGFSPREREEAVRSEWSCVSLGPRILRTETAVLASLAACQTLWGDFKG